MGPKKPFHDLTTVLFCDVLCDFVLSEDYVSLERLLGKLKEKHCVCRLFIPLPTILRF